MTGLNKLHLFWVNGRAMCDPLPIAIGMATSTLTSVAKPRDNISLPLLIIDPIYTSNFCLYFMLIYQFCSEFDTQFNCFNILLHLLKKQYTIKPREINEILWNISNRFEALLSLKYTYFILLHITRFSSK